MVTMVTFVSHLDLSRAPYVLYGVKYIDLVTLGAFAPRYFLSQDGSDGQVRTQPCGKAPPSRSHAEERRRVARMAPLSHALT